MATEVPELQASPDQASPDQPQQRHLPEYLARGILGVSGVESLTLATADGRGVNAALVDLVDAQLPGAVRGYSGEAVAAVGELPGLRQALDAMSAGSRLVGPLDSLLDSDPDWYPLFVTERPHRYPGLPSEVVFIEARARLVGHPEHSGARDGVLLNQVYSYLEEVRADLLQGSVGLDGAARMVLGGTGGLGRGAVLTRSGQQTQIHLTQGGDLQKVTMGVEVELRVRREPMPGQPLSRLRRSTRDDAAAGVAAPSPNSVALRGDVTLLLPGALVTDSAAEPTTHVGMLEWLPNWHGTNGVQGAPLRTEIRRLLDQIPGGRAERLETDLKLLLSGERLRASLVEFTHPEGKTVRLHQQVASPYGDRTATARVRMRFTALTVGRELPELTLGVEDRFQDLHTESERWSRDRARDYDLGEGTVGGSKEIGRGVEAASGIRQESGARGEAGAVEVTLLYEAQVEVTGFTRGSVGGRRQLGAPRTGTAEGEVHLLVHKRDLPELVRRMEQADASYEPSDPGPAPGPESAPATDPQPAPRPVRDRGRRQYQELFPPVHPSPRSRRSRGLLAGAGLLAAVPGGGALVESQDRAVVPVDATVEVVEPESPVAPDKPVVIEVEPAEPVPDKTPGLIPDGDPPEPAPGSPESIPAGADTPGRSAPRRRGAATPDGGDDPPALFAQRVAAALANLDESRFFVDHEAEWVTVDIAPGRADAVTGSARVDPDVDEVTHSWPPAGPEIRLPVTYDVEAAAEHLVDPDQLVGDLVALGNGVEVSTRRELDRVAADAEQRAAYGGPSPIDTGWRRIAIDGVSRVDWRLALGGFYYRVTGTATVHPPVDGGQPVVELDYQVHVFDHDFWTRGGALEVPVDVLGELHREGAAQEFRVRGSTPLRRYVGELPRPAEGPSVTRVPQPDGAYRPGSIRRALAPGSRTGGEQPGSGR